MKFDILKPQSTSGAGRKAIQEDSVFPAVGEGTIHDKLFIVADGCGGDGKGFEASECFCKVMPDFFFQNTCPDEPFTDDMLDEALLNAANAMERKCPDSQGIHFALLYLHRHGVMAAHVGSAGIYHIRPRERSILYHSAEDIRTFMPKAEQMVEPTRAHIVNVQYGDYFVLLTKGADACISESKMLEIICEPVNDNTKLIRMIKQLSDCPDNYSITIVHVSGVMNEAMDEHLEGGVLSAAVASQVTAAKNTGAEEEPTTPSQPSEAQHEEVPQKPAKPRNTVKPERPSQPQKPVKPARQRVRDEEEEDSEKSGFPVVLVTALVIVALGVFAWWWMTRSSKHNETETPAIEVKTDSAKKDTINIMKGEKPKALDLPEDKKTETKTEQPQKKTEEKPDEPVVSETDNTEGNPAPSAGEEVTQPQPQQPEQPQQPQQPAEEFKSEVTPVTTPTPGTVTPRPVIPEGE